MHFIRYIQINTPLFVIIFLASCNAIHMSEPASQIDNTERLLYLTLIQDPSPVADYIRRAQTGLSSWQIGLDTNLLSSSRTTNPGFVMQPANWITTANAACNARGIPSSWQGDVCSLNNGVIGLCITRYSTSTGINDGMLLDTTLVILDTFQASSSVSELEKQSVFTHEVGHCLGLAHTTSNVRSCSGSSTVNTINYSCGGSALNCLMYFNTDGANTPSSTEISAVQAAYQPVTAPSGADKNLYSTSCVGSPHNALRHFGFPQFYISATIGKAFSTSSAPDPDLPRQPMPADYEIQVHAYHANGDFETRIYDRNYRLLGSTR